MFSKKHFLIGCFFGVILLSAFIFSLPDGKTHLVFCNVGQGDSSYIRTPNGSDVLIDGGPDNSVLTCLGKNMPFYDRTIDLIFLSHPQKDHYKGLFEVFKRFKVREFVHPVFSGEEGEYLKLIKLADEKKIKRTSLFAGDKITLDSVDFRILWPEKGWFSQNAELAKASNDAKVLGLFKEKRDPNDYSYYIEMVAGNKKVLFTGDGDTRVSDDIMKRIRISDIDILKVPHHGSKYAFSDQFLSLTKPEMAIISVGKNSFGHPAKEALEMLQNIGAIIHRTDREGDIQLKF